MPTKFLLSMCFLLLISCHKENNSPESSTLKLVQNDWSVISVKYFLPNGSNYLLLSDNQSFRKDNYLITETSGIGSTFYDTTKYQLLTDDSTLLFYAVRNGVQDMIADTAFIDTISDNLFVYYFRQNGFINTIDSLKR